MDAIYAFYLTHPFWVWLAAGAVLLAVEVMTGSGYLLWPAAAAAIVGLATLGLRLGFPVELGLFAALTLVMTLLARRYLPNPFRPSGPDINDTVTRLIGHRGHAASDFEGRHGRVFVDGKEWAAELATGDELVTGAEIQVVGFAGGAMLKVQPA
jgi:membrane protein implicated in regulation of membrane protease activity